MKRCVWCGELRDRLALPDGERVCRGCIAYKRFRAAHYGEPPLRVWGLRAYLDAAVVIPFTLAPVAALAVDTSTELAKGA